MKHVENENEMNFSRSHSRRFIDQKPYVHQEIKVRLLRLKIDLFFIFSVEISSCKSLGHPLRIELTTQ